MPERRYVIRRFVAAGTGFVVNETTVVGLEQARYAAGHFAAHCLGVLLLDPDRGIVERFGDVPDGS